MYEFLLRFVVSGEVKAKVAKKWLDASFATRLIDAFASEDPRERDYLKTILHRVYGKFMSHRALIRRAIGAVFSAFVFEPPEGGGGGGAGTGERRHAGIGELLEILGSVINGFALPLKAEHVSFLERCLIPLHRHRALASYHQQLVYCVTQVCGRRGHVAALRWCFRPLPQSHPATCGGPPPCRR